MNQEEVVLAAFSAVPDSAYTPVQVQKVLFLIDERASEAIDGKKFNFQPYAYGPFDSNVYKVLDQLASLGFVRIDGGGKYRTYNLTTQGQEKGNKIFIGLDKANQQKMKETVELVRSFKSFSELVSYIYREFPEMKVNSVFAS